MVPVFLDHPVHYSVYVYNKAVSVHIY